MHWRTRTPAAVPAGVKERTLRPIWMEILSTTQAGQAHDAKDAKRQSVPRSTVTPVSEHDVSVFLSGCTSCVCAAMCHLHWFIYASAEWDSNWVTCGTLHCRPEVPAGWLADRQLGKLARLIPCLALAFGQLVQISARSARILP